MPTLTERFLIWGTILTIVGLLVNMGSSWGETRGDVADNTKEIESLRTKVETMSTLVGKTQTDVGYIRGRLDLVYPPPAKIHP